jgi:chromosomal replication initiation ATPase DnaA
LGEYLVSYPSQFTLALPQSTAYSAEDFAVSASNTHAYEAIMQWPDWQQPVLVLTGEAASGKTHLAHIWAQRSDAQFLDPQHLTRDKVKTLVEHGGASQAWALDPITTMVDETALFHLLNAVREQGGWLLLTTATPPAQMDIALADLRSRLCAAPLALLHEPDDVALTAVLIKQFADKQLRVTEDVLQYLLRRMDRSFAAAQQWVQRLDNAALARQSKISVHLVRQLMDA